MTEQPPAPDRAPGSDAATQPLRVLLVGAGFIGAFHAHTLRNGSGTELAAVMDQDPEAARRLAEQYDVPWFGDLGEALTGCDATAVVVCTPTGTHADLALAAIRADRHVLIEKPADISTERVDPLIEAARQHDVRVGVVSQHRFDPSTEIVAELVEQGALGTLTSGIASTNWWRGQDYYDAGGWRGTWALDGGGALTNQGIHAVDVLLSLMGRPVEVSARTAMLAHERIEVEDVAAATVLFESGAIGILHATTAAYPGLSVRISVMGSRGSAVIDNDELIHVHAARDAEGDQGGYGADPAASNQVAAYRERGPVAPGYSDGPGALSDSHERQWEDFARAVAEHRPPRVGLVENRRCLAVIEAVYASAAAGGAPVRVDA